MRARGPSGAMIWLGVALASTYGFYQISVTNAEKRACLKEKREARMAIMPFLMAEQDAMNKVETEKKLAYEKEVMKNVKGWEVGKSVYSKRWSPPTTGLSS